VFLDDKVAPPGWLGTRETVREPPPLHFTHED
jgi:hypothetical protein